MHRPLFWGLITSALLFVIAGLSSAHPDDPKTRDRQPRYEGPGWRAGASSTRGGPPINFPSQNIQLRSWLPLGDFGNHAEASDCWGYTSPSGRKYAFIGLSSGTGFVEISDPDNPTIITVKPGPTSIWRDIKVYNQTAYVVSEGGDGIQVYDISRIDQGLVTQHPNVTAGGNEATHNVAIDTVSGFLYRCGGSNNGIRIYDLSNELSPAFVTSWSERYVHDAQIVTYTSGPYAGRQIAFCCSGFNGGATETGIDILDVTEKNQIELLARYEYPDNFYSHQAWLSPDRRYLYLNDEFDEANSPTLSKVIVINVEDLTAPFFATAFTNSSTAITHNLYTLGDYIFEANYRSGVRVIDASDPLNMSEVAFFDSYPDNDAPQFNGMWSVYPYYTDGVMIGSDIEKGLFVWTHPYLPPPPPVPPALSYPNGLPTTIDPNNGSIPVEVIEQTPGDLDPSSPSLHYWDGAEFVQVGMTFVSGTTYEAEFPILPCGEGVTYYFSYRDSLGTTYTDPPGAPADDIFASFVAFDRLSVFEDNMDSDTGWSVGDPMDTAITGIWERIDPNPTGAQPADDNELGGGVMAWITGQHPVGQAVGINDVDGGSTTLTSPPLDATAGEGDAFISYFRWYSNNQGNNPNEDSMPVQISNGGPWVNLEVVTENAGEWVYRQFRVSDFVTPTSQLRVRFIARDLNLNSVVEAGVDDILLEFVDCTPDPTGLAGDLNGDCSVDLVDLNLIIGNFGVQYDVNDLNTVIGNFGTVCDP